MADTDVASLKQARDQLQTQLNAKNAELAAAKRDPSRALDIDGLTQEVRSLTDQRNQANNALSQAITANNRQNPPPKTAATPTPAQAAQNETAQVELAQKEYNLIHFGRFMTDEDMRKADQAGQPKPARTDSPTQIQTAATGATNAATTATHSANTDAQAAVDAQIRALTAAGTAANTARSTISTEGQKTADIGLEGIKTVADAAKAGVVAISGARDADSRMAQAKFEQSSTTLNNLMKNAVEIAMISKKGSGIAKKFMTGALASYKSSLADLGATGDAVPALNTNNPAFQALMNIAGYKLPSELPTVPTPAEMDYNTAVFMAVAGMPVPGWNGPIGVEAIKLYQKQPGQGTPNVDAAATDPDAKAKAAAQTPEGQRVIHGLLDPVAAIASKPADQRTPQEQATLDSALAAAKDRLAGIDAPVSGGASDDVSKKMADTVMNGTPQNRDHLMGLIYATERKKEAGLPLSPTESELLANVTPDKLAVIKSTMTPDYITVLQKQEQGQQLTPEEQSMIDNGHKALQDAWTPKPQIGLGNGTVQQPTDLTGVTAPPSNEPVPSPDPDTGAMDKQMIYNPMSSNNPSQFGEKWNMPAMTSADKDRIAQMATAGNGGNPTPDIFDGSPIPSLDAGAMARYQRYLAQQQASPMPSSPDFLNPDHASIDFGNGGPPLTPIDGNSIQMPVRPLPTMPSPQTVPNTIDEDELKRRGLFTGPNWFNF